MFLSQSLRMPKRKSSRSSRTSLESHSDNEDDLQGASCQRRPPFTRSTSSLMAPERPKLAPKPAHRKSTSSLSQPLTRQKTAPPGRPAAPVPAQRASLRQSASFDGKARMNAGRNQWISQKKVHVIEKLTGQTVSYSSLTLQSHDIIIFFL